MKPGSQKRGRFITIEGGEGAGKSTLLQHLLSVLRSPSQEVIATREPGGTVIAEKIRELFTGTASSEALTSEAELFLIAAARAQHVSQLILPALQRGAWVLCDRFADSTRVYQGTLGGLREDLIEATIAAASFGLEPTLTLYLDCPPALGQERLRERKKGAPLANDGVARYDAAHLELHLRLQEGFRQLAKKWPQRIKLLDARKSPELIAADALRYIRENC